MYLAPETIALLISGLFVTIFWCFVMSKVLDKGTPIISIGISLYVGFFLLSVGIAHLLGNFIG